MSFEFYIWYSLGLCASFAAGVGYGIHVCHQQTKKLFKNWLDLHEGQ